LAEDINLLENSEGAKVQTLAQASYDAWIKAYRPNENSGNSTISYYTKGSVIALLLDLEIIQDSKGQYSLDDVMKYMYNEYYKVKKRGYTDAEFKAGLEKFAGKNLDDFYAKYINGLNPVDYNHYLGFAGYKISDELADNNDPALGLTFVANIPRLIVATVTRNSAAWKDGINVNDEIIAIDDEPVTEAGKLLTGKKVGDKIKVTLIRDGLSMEIPVTLLKSTKVKYKIEELPNPSAEQLAVRKKWLTLK